MNIKRYFNSFFVYSSIAALVVFTACSDKDDEIDDSGLIVPPSSADFTDLLTNQIDAVILPSMATYQSELTDLETALNNFASSVNASNLTSLRTAYHRAYLAYQAVAVHNYFATTGQVLVENTNLYPVDTAILTNLISSRSYNFNARTQERANGFPAIDFMLFGTSDVLAFFNADTNRIAFLQALVSSMKVKSDALVSQWNGFRTNFIDNGGTSLGSSIGIQLNQTLIYYENHIRENKVGIPIGRLGPNDSPIAPDPAKIEAFHESISEGNENFTMNLLRAAVEEMEDTYLGESIANVNGQGYDDLLITRGHAAIDSDIKAQYANIFHNISNRSSISGNDSLYLSIQRLVALYKSDLFPVLNVQDADGANDGD